MNQEFIGALKEIVKDKGIAKIYYSKQLKMH